MKNHECSASGRRHQEWLKFLMAADYVVLVDRQIHMK
jgi:hypothetical protein